VLVVLNSWSYLYLGEICCEDGRRMELAQDCVQWQALILAALKLRIQLPVSSVLGK
jgi:hypothetical protein